MTRQPTVLDRLLAAIPFAVAGLALLALLFWQASTRKTPTIFGDELEWAQISRAIEATGHAARRGQPIGLKSAYAIFLAPFWWIHSTSGAYTAIKYANTLLMAATAIPAYLIARTLVSSRVAILAALGTLCTSALFYAPYLLPEVAAYPVFVLGAWLSITALTRGGWRWIAAAVVVDFVAVKVRGELITLPAAFALAAAILFVCGPRSARLRRNWSVFDHVGAAILLVGALIVLNALAASASHEWSVVTSSWMDRFWSLGMESASAFAIGLGLLPFVAGLAALWLPARLQDPAWRAFAAFTASAILTVWIYTAVKAAYNSTIFATRVEERNLIYLGPLLIVGTAVWLCERRRWLPGTLAAWAFTIWLVVYYGYQLDFPYFEAPGYGIAAMANRAFHWDQPTIQIAMGTSMLVLLLVLVFPPTMRGARVVALVAAAGALTWMLAGEVTSSRGAAKQSRLYADHLPKPLSWIDEQTHGDGVTYMGQNITLGQALGVNLLEFWNRSVHNIWSLDGSAPGPGPVTTPDLLDERGTLSSDPGLPYAVVSNGVDLVGSVVARRPGLNLVKLDRHPWHLRQASYGVSDDGWISSADGEAPANGTYAYFGPQTTKGVLHVDVSRLGFCAETAPSTHVVVRVGPVTLNEQRAPYVVHATQERRFTLENCKHHPLTFDATPPVAVQVSASPTVRLTDYGGSDNRNLGAQVGFSFSPR